MITEMPQVNHAYTQIKHKIEFVNCFTSSRVDDFPKKIKSTTLDMTHYLDYPNSTRIMVKKDSACNNSSWQDFIDENFDITTRVTYTKKFKVKAKIIKKSKFTPKIIID